jgi:hypothetical protein
MIGPVTFDHLAIGVERWRNGYDPLRTRFGGRWAYGGDGDAFLVAQLAYRHDFNLELIAPRPGESASFMRRFLDKTGPGPHHLTFKVASLDDALAAVTKLGIGTLGGRTNVPFWHEVFLHPKAAGVGTLVQLAQVDDEFLGPTLRKSVPPDDLAPTFVDPAGISWIGLTVQSLVRAEQLFADVLDGTVLERGAGWLRIGWASGHVLLVRTADATPHRSLGWAVDGRFGVGQVVFGPTDLRVDQLDTEQVQTIGPYPLLGTTLLTVSRVELVDQPDRAVDLRVDILGRQPLHIPTDQADGQHRVDRDKDGPSIRIERTVEGRTDSVVELVTNGLVDFGRIRISRRLHHHHDSEELRLQLEGPDNSPEDVPESLRFRVAEGGGLVELPLQYALPLQEGCREQVLLGREVAIQGSQGDSGLTGDIGYSCVFVVAAGQNAQRRQDDPLPACGLVRGQRIWRRRTSDSYHLTLSARSHARELK